MRPAPFGGSAVVWVHVGGYRRRGSSPFPLQNARPALSSRRSSPSQPLSTPQSEPRSHPLLPMSIPHYPAIPGSDTPVKARGCLGQIRCALQTASTGINDRSHTCDRLPVLLQRYSGTPDTALAGRPVTGRLSVPWAAMSLPALAGPTLSCTQAAHRVATRVTGQVLQDRLNAD